MNKIYISNSTNPYHNLAIEEYLFSINRNDIILYLWQNENTIVIGKHQNPYKECNLLAMSKDDVVLSRRTSGGGAVYHDLGNLNFTFILPTKEFNVQKQLQVIIDTLKEFNINTIFTGRNDITLENGQKVSGNAFRQNSEMSIHHGTLLIDVDMNKLTKYLTPSKTKFISKGFDSVKSRVANLKQINQNISDEILKRIIIEKFTDAYGEYELLTDAYFDTNAIGNIENKNQSFDWLFGNLPKYNAIITNRFSFGEMEFSFFLEKGIIKDITIYSDAINEGMIDDIENILKNTRFTQKSIIDKLGLLSHEEVDEIITYFEMNGI